MNTLFEYTDKLNKPFECFIFDTKKEVFPILPHWHYFTEILLILDGKALISCNDVTYHLERNDLILFPPSSIHAIYSTDQQPLRYYVLKFDLNQLNNAITTIELGSLNFTALFQNNFLQEKAFIHFPFSLPEYDTYASFVHTIFEQTTAEMFQQQLGYHTVAQSNICQLLILLLRFLREKEIDTDIFSPIIEDVSINTITEYIDRHLNENLLVEDLAQMCNMSYSHFAKNFHVLYGQSCKKYINLLRLYKAENMLMFTNYDLTYISQECGFSDCSHLIHQFKQKYGVTPHQYRLRKI